MPEITQLVGSRARIRTRLAGARGQLAKLPLDARALFPVQWKAQTPDTLPFGGFLLRPGAAVPWRSEKRRGLEPGGFLGAVCEVEMRAQPACSNLSLEREQEEGQRGRGAAVCLAFWGTGGGRGLRMGGVQGTALRTSRPSYVRLRVGLTER